MPTSLKHEGKKERGVTYTQLPVPLKMSVYDKAREWIIDFFSKIDEVAAVYEYGTVRSPGLSDLDLMVVLKDKIKNKNLYNKLLFKDAPESFSVLANNDSVKFIEKKYFRNINRLGEFRKKLLYGEDIKFNGVSEQDKKLFRIALVMDFLTERILTLLEYREGKTMPVADTIGTLKSYLCSAKMAQELTRKNIKEVDEFENRINRAREGWFLKNYPEQIKLLLRIIDKAVSSGAKIAQSFASFLTENGYYSRVIGESGSFFFFNAKKAFSFYGSGEKISAREKSYFIKQGCVFLPVPAIWLSHLYFYGMHKGVISSGIRDNFILKRDIFAAGIGKEMSEVLSFRINMCNQMAQSLQKLGIPTHKLYRFAHIQSIKKDIKH